MARFLSFFAAACLCIFFAASGHAQEAGSRIEITREQAEKECAPYPQVPINIYPVFEEPHYDYSLTIGQLQSLANNPAHNVHGTHKGLTLGLTHYEPIIEMRAPLHSITFPHSTSCTRVVNVDIQIGYRNVTVYIPREVPDGSCGFAQVMAHEQKHISVNREILDAYAPLIVKKLQDYLRYNGVLRQENAQYGVDVINRKMHEIVTEVAQHMTEENQRRQQWVDSAEEYRRISASCNGQLNQAALRYYRGQ